jgi:farnesyl diphosphate synthase
MATFNPQVDAIVHHFEQALKLRLPPEETLPATLYKAMRYSALDGGKRIRPLLVYLTGALFDLEKSQLDAPATAVEMIHVYSLVHDDLPAMDDDDLRRGKATCHKRFNEATAILVGDALQSLAFEILANDPDMHASPSQRLLLISELARAAGHSGMVGGQMIDMDSEGRSLTLHQLMALHRRKTGALILAAVRMGYLLAEKATPLQQQSLDNYARAIGLAFQIQDDILDVEGTTEALGKPQGSDHAAGKSTYPGLMGVDGAKSEALRLQQEALSSLRQFDQRAEPLRDLARFIVERAS